MTVRTGGANARGPGLGEEPWVAQAEQHGGAPPRRAPVRYRLSCFTLLLGVGWGDKNTANMSYLLFGEGQDEKEQ